jgi:circadian clock protein KaiB
VGPMANGDTDLHESTDSILRLYVAGNSPSSHQAQQHLKQLQMLMKAEGFRVEIVDVLADPALAEKESVLATPTLCYERSGRRRRIIGDLGDPKRILTFLGIEMKGDAT